MLNGGEGSEDRSSNGEEEFGQRKGKMGSGKVKSEKCINLKSTLSINLIIKLLK